MRRLLEASYAILAYLGFNLVCIWFFAFNANLWLAHTVDRGPTAALEPALLGNLALISLFGLSHSVMARPRFKGWWTRIVPAHLERSTYVWVSNLTLALLFLLWRPIDGALWTVDWQPAVYVIWSLYGLGWAFAIVATNSIDLFALVGIKQALKRPADVGFKTPALYRVCRHPLMFGLLLVFWATPAMTVGRLVMAVGLTSYMLIGLQFEERALLREFGDTYRRYQDEVPMLIPGLRRTRQSGKPAQAG